MRLIDIIDRLRERSCNFTTGGACAFLRENMLDRSPAPCGSCDIADEVAKQASAGKIDKRNKDAVGGRTNWEVLLEHPDNYTVQARTVSDRHEGPVVARIQSGEIII